MATINIDQLTNEILNELNRFVNVVEADMEELADKVANEALKELKVVSPKLTNDYSKGWKKSIFKTARVLHNKTDYQLTHLLEKGHAKVGGGRVQAYPHIAAIERKVVNKFISETERLIANANS